MIKVFEKTISLEELPGLVNEILNANLGKVFIFKGEVGAGKTTTIKTICQQLEVNELVTSPTYSIVNEYSSKNGSIYHFDFYRLNDIEEAFDIGIEEMFYSDAYCLIEWPELIASFLPKDRIEIEITKTGDKRHFIINKQN
jgi:tRNA threonylcarbamoyladenosine biosynthesis protein TsaE